MNVSGPRIVAEARKWLGTPYVHQASIRGRGCDCLGLVRGVWRAVYGAEPANLPPYSRDYGDFARTEPVLQVARNHLREVGMAEMRPGDVLLLRWPGQGAARHLAILTEADRLIHAWERAGVVEVGFPAIWQRRLAAVFRFPEI